MTRENMQPHLERAVYGFGIVNPLMALPQLYQIWVLQHVSGLSLITVGGAFVMSLLWTTYGVVGRQTVLWVTSSMWIAMNGLTLVGVALFR